MQTDQVSQRPTHAAAPGLSAQSGGFGQEIRATPCQIVPIIGPDYCPEVIKFIRRATRKIDIASYCWKWYEFAAKTAIQRLNYAIIERARHGLPIRARFNHESKDHPLSTENTNTASKLRRYGIQTKFDGTAVMSHLKMIIIDDEIAILGSHNLTTRSVSQNNEASVAIIGREAVRPFRDYFEALWTPK